MADEPKRKEIHYDDETVAKGVRALADIRAQQEWLRTMANPGPDAGSNTTFSLMSYESGGGRDDKPLPQPVVQLRGMAQKPIVCGKEVDPLTTPRYKVIAALLDAGPDGMSKSEIEKVSADAVRYLRELSDLPQWKKAIIMPGGPWIRYGIVYKTTP